MTIDLGALKAKCMHGSNQQTLIDKDWLLGLVEIAEAAKERDCRYMDNIHAIPDDRDEAQERYEAACERLNRALKEIA